MSDRPSYVPSDISDDAVAFMRRCGVIREDDSIDASQVCREMSDFQRVIGQCSEVYAKLSGGLVSKPLTDPEVVIKFSEEREEFETAEAIKDATEELRDELAEMRAVLVRVQTHRYHEPDSDALEYCFGCGQSPYHKPQHEDGCLVVAVAAALRGGSHA